MSSFLDVRAAQLRAQGQEPAPEDQPDWSGVGDEAPATLGKVLEDPAFAAAAKDDVPFLAQVEAGVRTRDFSLLQGVTGKFLRSAKDVLVDAPLDGLKSLGDLRWLQDTFTDVQGSYEHAQKVAPLYDLRAKIALGGAEPYEVERADRMSRAMPKHESPFANDPGLSGILEQVPGKTAEFAGSIASRPSAVIAPLLAGAGGFLVAGPPGAKLGFGAGLGASLATHMGLQAMGQFAEEMKDATLEDGTPVNPDVVRGGALVLGLVNGALGALPVAAIASRAGLTDRLLGQGGQAVMRRLLTNPSAAAALTRFAVKFTTAEGAQAVVGVLQELSTIAAEQVVTDGGRPLNLMERIPAAAVGAAQMGVPFSAVEGAVPHGKALALAAAESAHAVAVHENLGRLSEAVVFQKDKVAQQDLAARIATNKVQSVSYPREKLVEFARQNGLDISKTMPDVQSQLDATNGDPKAEIRVSPEQNAAYIASSKGFKALRNDMRSGGGFTLREVDALVKETRGAAQLPKPPELPAAIKPVLDEARAEVAKAFPGPVADAVSTIYASAVNSLAEATGRTPQGVHKSLGLEVVKKMAAQMDERSIGIPGEHLDLESVKRFNILDLGSKIPGDDVPLQNLLAQARQQTRGTEGAPKFTGTWGELWEHLKLTAGSKRNAVKVLADMGFGGMQQNGKSYVWHPDVLLPKTDPLATTAKTSFEPGKTTMMFGPQSNVISAFHEFSHVFLRMWHEADLETKAVVQQGPDLTGQRKKFTKEHSARQAKFDEELRVRAEEFKSAMDSGDWQKIAKDKYEEEQRAAAAQHEKERPEGAAGVKADKAYMQAQDQRLREYKRSVGAETAEREAAFKASQTKTAEDFTAEQDKRAKEFDKRFENAPKTGKKVENPHAGEMSANMDKLRKWLGADASGGLTSEQEEKFVDALIRHARTGGAPSLWLGRAFGQLNGWMASVYGAQAETGVHVPADIGHVMDRMLASRRAVAEARKQLVAPLFEDAESAGMTEKEFARYQRQLNDALATATNEMDRAGLANINAQGIDAFDRQKKMVREELIATDVTNSLVSFLRDGERLDDGPHPLATVMDPAAEGVPYKLDTRSLEKMGAGPGLLKKLEGLHAAGGLDPHEVARAFSYKDGHEMLSALEDHVPLEQATAIEAAKRMPGWVDPEKWLSGRAADKLSEDVVPQLLVTELRALGSTVPGGDRAVEVQRAAVQLSMRRLPVSSLVPEHFLREYQRLGEGAAKALGEDASGRKKREQLRAMQDEAAGLKSKAGKTAEDIMRLKALKDSAEKLSEFLDAQRDKLAAADFKQRQWTAFEQWREARRVLEEQAKLTAYATHLREDEPTRARLARSDNARGLNAVDAALEAYGYKEPGDVPRKETAGEYVAEETKKRLADIVEDPSLGEREEAKHPVQAFTVEEQRQAQRFLASLVHHVEQADEFRGGLVAKPLVATVQLLTKHIKDNVLIVDRDERSKGVESALSLLRRAGAEATNGEHVLRDLDGGDPHGLLNQTLLQPLVDGEMAKHKNQKALRSAFEDFYHAMSEEERVKLGDRTAFRVNKEGPLDHLTGQPTIVPGRALYTSELLALLLNRGNPHNIKSMLEGYHLKLDELDTAFAKYLSPAHAEFARSVWKLMEDVLPDASATYAKRTGVPLDAVKPMPFVIHFASGDVELPGGYYPVKYSAEAKHTHDMNRTAFYRAEDFNSADVEQSFVQEREQSKGPIELSLGVMMGHLQRKVHYAAMYNPVQEVNKIVSHPEFRKAISETIGPEFNKTLDDMLRNSAREGIPAEALSTWDRAQRAVMVGATQATIGLNSLTASMQLYGMIPSLRQVAPGHIAAALTDILSDWSGNYERAEKQSKELSKIDVNLSHGSAAWRLLAPDVTLDARIETKMMGLGRGKLFRDATEVQSYLQTVGMSQIAATQKLVNWITFEAAKRQGIEQNRVDPFAYADAVLRQTQGGVDLKDMPNVIAKPGLAKSSQMFYSWMSVVAQEMMSQRGEPITLASMARKTASLATFVLLPVTLEMMVKQSYKDAPPTDDALTFASWMARAQFGLMLSRGVPVLGDPLGSLIAPDAPGHGGMGGALGMLSGATRGTVKGLMPGQHFDPAAAAKFASFLTKTPLSHLYQGTDYALDLANGRYGDRAYSVYVRGKKKEGFR